MFSDQKINGEQTYVIKYDAIDNENVRCRVTIVVYEKLDLMQLYGKYSDISICYDCVLSGKLNETSDL